MWTSAAAQSKCCYERRQGQAKLLLVRNLDVSYGNVQVLFDVDLEVDEGEIVALLGTNGAGKSTLLKAICGLVEADDGAIIFDGRDMTLRAARRDRGARRRRWCPAGRACSRRSPSPRTCGSRAGCTARTRPAPARGDRPRCSSMFPVLARAPRRAGRQPLGRPAADARASAWRSSSRPRLLMIDELSLGLAPVIVEQLLPDRPRAPRRRAPRSSSSSSR